MAKIQVVLLVVVAAGILAFVYAVCAEDPNPSIGFTGLSAATLRSNMLPDLGTPPAHRAVDHLHTGAHVRVYWCRWRGGRVYIVGCVFSGRDGDSDGPQWRAARSRKGPSPRHLFVASASVSGILCLDPTVGRQCGKVRLGCVASPWLRHG